MVKSFSLTSEIDPRGCKNPIPVPARESNQKNRKSVATGFHIITKPKDLSGRVEARGLMGVVQKLVPDSNWTVTKRKGVV